MAPDSQTDRLTNVRLVYTRNERAKRAHSFYTCLKHQLMLASIIVLLSSTLDYVACMMLDPQLYNHV